MYYYLCAVFTLISVSVSFGFSIDAYLKSRSEKGVANNNAKYALARSISIMLAAIGLFIIKSDSYLIAISAIMIVIQFIDGIIGIKISKFKTYGPLLTAGGNLVLLILFLQNSL